MLMQRNACQAVKPTHDYVSNILIMTCIYKYKMQDLQRVIIGYYYVTRRLR